MDILQQDISGFVASFTDYEQLRGKSFAITGATGLLGSVTIKCLMSLNERYHLNLRILAVVRNTAKALAVLGEESECLMFYNYDFTSSDRFNPPLTVDFIIHYASPTASKYFVQHPVETITAGINGTREILEYAKDTHLQGVVYLSSMEAYGQVVDDAKPLTESCQGYVDLADARSSYPMAKRAAECLCHAYFTEYDIPVRIIRLAQTFGAGVARDDNRVFAQFAHSVMNSQNIVLFTQGEQKHCYCYTIDAVKAVLCVLLKGKDGETYNVANEQTYISILEMAQFVCKEFNQKVKTVIQLQDGMGYPPPTKLKLDTSKIRALGWAPQYNLRQMFTNLIVWFR